MSREGRFRKKAITVTVTVIFSTFAFYNRGMCVRGCGGEKEQSVSRVFELWSRITGAFIVKLFKCNFYCLEDQILTKQRLDDGCKRVLQSNQDSRFSTTSRGKGKTRNDRKGEIFSSEMKIENFPLEGKAVNKPKYSSSVTARSKSSFSLRYFKAVANLI